MSKTLSYAIGITIGLLIVIAIILYGIRKDLESQAKTKSVMGAQMSVEDHYNTVVEVVGKYSGADSSGVVRPDSFIVKDAGKLKIVQVREGSKLVSLEPVPKYMRKTYGANNNPVYTPILDELIPPGK